MRGCCESSFGFFKTRVPTSSAGHRNTQRLNAGLQISSGVLQNTAPAIITIKVAQTLVSAHAVLRKDTHNEEKLLHAGLALLSLAQVALGIALYVQDDECILMDALCKSAYICELVYQGALLTGWVASEASKDSPVPAAAIAPGP